MNKKDYFNDPEFWELQSRAEKAQEELGQVLKLVEEKWPAGKNYYWSMSLANTLGRFPRSNGEDYE